MNFKWWPIPASLICGIVGGMLGNWLMSCSRSSATFETVRVTKDLFVAPSAEAEKGCRLAADGTVTATGGVIGNQVRGNVIIGRALLASTNATQQTLENQNIAVEISANDDRGGELILRNRDGVLCPAKGPVTRGYATVIGFDPGSQTPAIYTHDISQGPQGRAFAVYAKPGQPPASQTNQAAAPRAQVR